MKKQEIKFKGKTNFYSIIIGKNTINLLPEYVQELKKLHLYMIKMFQENS